MNQHIIVGNVGRDAEFRNFENGGKIATFSVASSERWKDKGGEWKERTTWHNVVVRSPYALKVAEDVRKGKRVMVIGKVETRAYEKDGDKRYVTETVINMEGNLQIIADAKKKDSEASHDDNDKIPF